MEPGCLTDHSQYWRKDMRQCNGCGYIDGIDGHPESTGYIEFCSHDIFDGMPGQLSDNMTDWVFKLANDNNCPLFVKHGGRT